MGILLDSFWMLHHDTGARAIKDVVLLALTIKPQKALLMTITKMRK